MKFNYSTSRLLVILFNRLVPTVLFVIPALFWGGIFWVVTAIFWLEAIVEIFLRYKNGYSRIEKDYVQTQNLVFTKRVYVSEIIYVFTYDQEWTFRTKETEIRIDKKRIQKSQRNLFDQMIQEFRSQIQIN